MAHPLERRQMPIVPHTNPLHSPLSSAQHPGLLGWGFLDLSRAFNSQRYAALSLILPLRRMARGAVSQQGMVQERPVVGDGGGYGRP